MTNRDPQKTTLPLLFWSMSVLLVGLALLPQACVVSAVSNTCQPCPCSTGFVCAGGLCVPPEKQADPLAFCFVEGGSLEQQRESASLEEPSRETPLESAEPEKINSEQPPENNPPTELTTPDEPTLPENVQSSEERSTSEEPNALEKNNSEQTTEPPPCNSDRDCPRGQICDANQQCRAGNCTKSDQCSEFQACITNTCQPCQLDDQCADRGTGYTCQHGLCTRQIKLQSGTYLWSDGSAAADCMGYLYPSKGFVPATQDGVYLIKPNNDPAFPALCDMTHAGGGWTLVLRVDGKQNTFAYEAALWTNQIPTPNASNLTALTKEQVKLPSYWSVPFTQVLLRNESDPQHTPILLDIAATSALALFQRPANAPFPSSKALPPRSAWRSLVPGTSLQKECGNSVVNFTTNDLTSSFRGLRLGFITDGTAPCTTHNGMIGVGVSPLAVGSNTLSAGNLCTKVASCEKRDFLLAKTFGLFVRKLPSSPLSLVRRNNALEPPTGSPPPSCLAYRMPPYNQEANDNYWIQPVGTTQPIPVYCEMNLLGGGWSAILKADGNKANLDHASSLWTKNTPFNETTTTTPDVTSEYKLSTYHTLPTNELLIAMSPTGKKFSDANYFSLQFKSIHLLDAMQHKQTFDNQDHKPWLDLLPNSELHTSCNKGGFNVTSTLNAYASFRIGMLGSSASGCANGFSFVGFGGKTQLCQLSPTLKTGNAFCASPLGQGKSIPALGYLFAR